MSSTENLSKTAAEKRAIYRRLCVETYIPLHSRAWWLDAVCGADEWEVALTVDGKGAVTGALPYAVSKGKFGIRRIINPPLTMYNNLYLAPPDNPDIKAVKIASFRLKTVRELLAQLPPVTFFRQQTEPDLRNAAPWQQAGFKQTESYTYRFSYLADYEKLYANIAYNLRHGMKQARRETKIIERYDPDLLFALNEKSYAAKQKRLPYTLDFLRKICVALQKNAAGQMLFAENDRSGKISAGLLIAYDEKTAYALVAGLDRKGGHAAALNLLYAAALEKAAERTDVFDFQGSKVPEIERIYRNFGAERTPYHLFYKFENRLWEAAAVLAGKI